MNELEGLSAALRQAAGNLTSAAASVGRVLESVAAALEPQDRPAATRDGGARTRRRSATKSAPAKRASVRPQKKASAPSARTQTSRSPAPSPQRTSGRRSSA